MVISLLRDDSHMKECTTDGHCSFWWYNYNALHDQKDHPVKGFISLALLSNMQYLHKKVRSGTRPQLFSPTPMLWNYGSLLISNLERRHCRVFCEKLTLLLWWWMPGGRSINTLLHSLLLLSLCRRLNPLLVGLGTEHLDYRICLALQLKVLLPLCYTM